MKRYESLLSDDALALELSLGVLSDFFSLDPSSEEEEEDDDDELSLGGDFRESVMYQPLPLKMIPAG
jgi:hypothetical protein